MKTWLFTWNEDRTAWDGDLDGYHALKDFIAQVGHAYDMWSCGTNKSILPGDRIFLIKLGSQPKGIVASGHAVTGVFEGAHWDEEKRKSGKTARRVYIEFDKVLDYHEDRILGFDLLNIISGNFKWSSQSSGIHIPDDISAELERYWKDY